MSHATAIFEIKTDSKILNFLFLVLVNLDTIKISLTANLIFLYIFISYPNFIGLIIIKLG
jgi:uncharacterized membrane protein YqhA